jgi:hypothetical protein
MPFLPEIVALLATFFISTATLPITETTASLSERHSSYNLICNNNNLNTNDIQTCIHFLTGPGAFVHTYVVPPQSDVLICPSNSVFVSGRALDNHGAQADQGQVGSALRDIYGTCGGRGGSASVVGGNENFIVHLNDHIV